MSFLEGEQMKNGRHLPIKRSSDVDEEITQNTLLDEADCYGFNHNEDNITDDNWKRDHIKVINQEQSSKNTEAGIYINFMRLIRFATRREKIQMIVATFLGILSGISTPLFVYLWGLALDEEVFSFKSRKMTLQFFWNNFIINTQLGLLAMGVQSLMFTLWKLQSKSVADRLRVKYLEKYLMQEISWLQQQNLYEITTKFKQQSLNIQKALGDRLGLLCNMVGLTASCYITALVFKPLFSLYVLLLMPIVLAIFLKYTQYLVQQSTQQAYFASKASTFITECVAMLKTIKILNCEQKIISEYGQQIADHSSNISKYPQLIGLMNGCFYFIHYLLIALLFSIGIHCVSGDSICSLQFIGHRYSVGQCLTVFFMFLFSSYNLLQFAENWQTITRGIRCSQQVFQFLNKEVNICDNSEHTDEIGDIEFKNVSFSYPFNPNKVVLKDLNLHIHKGDFDAIAGVTGSGKTTIVQLLMKFYSPTSGQILIGGKNINQIDTKWLRNQIGYVSQEPVLFSGSIRQNIQIGKPQASEEEIITAMKQAQIYDFILSQPKKLDSQVGIGGNQLSGGQKQRIALARALIKKPRLLILDQATSALDRKNQRMIQETIDQISKSQIGITMLVIAHRLNTLKNAKKIWYIENGRIIREEIQSHISSLQKVKKETEFNENISSLIDMTRIQTADTVFSDHQHTNKILGNGICRMLSYNTKKKLFWFSMMLAIACGTAHPFGSYYLSFALKQGYAINFAQMSFTPICIVLPFFDYCSVSVDSRISNVYNYTIVIAGIAVILFIIYFLKVKWMKIAENEFVKNIRLDSFQRIMKMGLMESSLDNNIINIQKDSREVGKTMTKFLPIVTQNIFIYLVASGITFYYDKLFGLCCIGVMPFMIFSSSISMNLIGKFEDRQLHEQDLSDNLAEQLIICIKTVHSLNYQEGILNKYIEKVYRPIRNTFFIGLQLGILFGINIFAILFISSLLQYLAAVVTQEQSITNLDAKIIFFTIVVWCGWISGNSLSASPHLASGKLSARNIFKIIDTVTQEEKRSTKTQNTLVIAKSLIKGKIQLINVSFGYSEKSNKVIKNVSLVVEAGQHVAFVGGSGCGKSTLLNLILGLYDYEGVIQLDGINVVDFSIQQYRSLFSAVNQEPSLFVSSLKNNIKINIEATDQDIFEAANLAQAYDLSQSSQNRQQAVADFLEREVGAKGTKISGGEKQRVACTRAILMKPAILILDEATSALDYQTEQKVLYNLKVVMKNKTIIQVTHRLETIRAADTIFFFDEGSLISSGTYSGLLSSCPEFRSFTEGQTYIR